MYALNTALTVSAGVAHKCTKQRLLLVLCVHSTYTGKVLSDFELTGKLHSSVSHIHLMVLCRIGRRCVSCLAFAAIAADGILCEYVQDILRSGSVGEPVSYLSPYPFLTLLIPGHNVLRYAFLAYGSNALLTMYSENVLHGREAPMLSTGLRHT